MERPKIGFLIPRLGIAGRGAESFVFELAKRMQKDFDVMVWVRKSKNKSRSLDDLIKMGVTIRRASCIPEEHFIAQTLYSFSPLRKFLNKFHLNPSELEMLSFTIACLPQLFLTKLDLLFPANGVWGSIGCRTIRFAKGTPFVYPTLGGIEPISIRQKPDLYIAFFPTIYSWVKKNSPKLKAELIPTGVDLKKFSSRGEKAFVDLPRPLFVTVSALISEKRVDLTIHAVGKLKKGSLLIVGDGPLKLPLMQLANETLGKKRFLFLKADHNDMPKYYRAADVFTFSAPWERGWSIVHLEALASGLPVVANREKNLEYLLGKNWELFCDVNNIDHYSKTLERATKIKVKSRELVKGYSWDKIASKYKKIFTGVINEQKKND